MQLKWIVGLAALACVACDDGGEDSDGGTVVIPMGGGDGMGGQGGDGVGGQGGDGMGGQGGDGMGGQGGGQGGQGGGMGGQGGGQGGQGGAGAQGGQGGQGGGQGGQGGGQGGQGGGMGGQGGGVEPLDCDGGWDDGPSQWRLPFALERFSALGSQSHAVLDLDGDGNLDFVVPNGRIFEDVDDPLVGRAYWLVWSSDSDGWQGEPRQWRIPFTLEQVNSPLASQFYALTDLTGDGLADFVYFRQGPGMPEDPLLGRAYWLVYENTGNGFAQDATQWTLPFALDENGDRRDLTTRAHTLIDLDGDGLLDFLVNRDEEMPEDDALVGKAYWLVYANTANGFERNPSQWRLPFSLDEDRDRSDVGTQDHALLDLDGDGRPDFVAFRDEEMPDNDPLIGKAYWKVFANNGNGFDADGADWRLPYSLNEDRNNSMAATQRHALLDLTGDGRVDFVVNQNGERPEDDPLLGRAYWLVYANNGDGFAGGEQQWRLPFALENDSTLGGQEHAISALDGSCVRFVLLQDGLAPEDDPLLGRAYWSFWH